MVTAENYPKAVLCLQKDEEGSSYGLLYWPAQQWAHLWTCSPNLKKRYLDFNNGCDIPASDVTEG